MHVARDEAEGDTDVTDDNEVADVTGLIEAADARSVAVFTDHSN